MGYGACRVIYRLLLQEGLCVLRLTTRCHKTLIVKDLHVAVVLGVRVAASRSFSLMATQMESLVPPHPAGPGPGPESADFALV
jgi:hypothetical protein